MRVHAVGGESIAYSYRVQLPKTQCGWDPLPRSCETLRNVVRCLTFQRGPCVFRVYAQGLIRPRGGESNPVIPVWLVAGGEQRGAVGAVVAAERRFKSRPRNQKEKAALSCNAASNFLVAGAGFEPATFGL